MQDKPMKPRDGVDITVEQMMTTHQHVARERVAALLKEHGLSEDVQLSFYEASDGHPTMNIAVATEDQTEYEMILMVVAAAINLEPVTAN